MWGVGVGRVEVGVVGLQRQSGIKCGVGSQRAFGHFFQLLVCILTTFEEKNTVF